MFGSKLHTLDVSRRGFIRRIGIIAGAATLVGAGLAPAPAAAGRLLHERQSLAATCALSGGDRTCVNNTLNDVHLDASYFWRDKIGLTIGAFDTTGSANPLLYAANRTLRPDSTGVLLQLDATPWGAGDSPLAKRFDTRVGIQYTAYTRFNGARDNWDGAGANAGDNNSLRLFVWSAY